MFLLSFEGLDACTHTHTHTHTHTMKERGLVRVFREFLKTVNISNR